MKPSLRFLEFKDEWQEKRLGDVFYFKKTNSLSRADFTEKGSISNIHYGDIHTKLPAYLDTRSYQLPKIVSIGKGIGEFVEVGDLSMVDASENYTDIGKSVEIVNICDKEKVVSGLHTLLLSPKEKHAIGFLGQYFQNGIIRKKIRKVANGISVLGISKNDLSKLTLLTPCIKEQEKIADFLRGGDERMVLLEKKVGAMREYKKGVMSAIFSGKLRFKDENGNPYPDWEEKRLGDIGKTYSGLSGKSGDDFGNGKPYITYMQIFKNKMISDEYAYVKVDDSEKQNKVQFGDILFTASSETPSEVGYTSVLLHHESELYLNSFCFGYRVNFNELRPEFAQFLFHSEETRRTIIKLAQGSTRFNISKTELMKISVKLPCLAEQRKIADFLSVIDRKIELEQTRLDRTKDFKKGLLQRMFV